MSKVITKETTLNGKTLKLETGKLAQQADAAVLVTLGETVVLATVATKAATEDIGYFPLSVEYVEKYYAGGRITGQKFIKRETRPSDKAILSGRAVDRSIRPLFPKDYRDELQVILTVLSFDGVNDPAIAGFIGASAALAISSTPFFGPIGVARIGSKGGQMIVNPDLQDLDLLDYQVTVSATSKRVVMVEAEGKEVKDDVMFDAIKKGFEENQTVVDFINEFAEEAKKAGEAKEKVEIKPLDSLIDEKVLKEAKELVHTRISGELLDTTKTWHDSKGEEIKAEIADKYAEVLTPLQVTGIFEKEAKAIMNDLILNQNKRIDGRGMEEVRPIYMEVELLPRVHGSALFQRGESQVLSVATLGPLSLSQTLEGMEGEAQKRFMHHYNMGINPFASGEVKRIGAPNRRDVGHGDLVERSFLGVLPSEQDFPYAIRVVSEVLGANASTSAASACGTTLALLDAGVSVKPVAGIALGLVTDHEDETKFKVITDMQAAEDFYGEMDFKIFGTSEGITGIQMDTKLTGITFEIIQEAIRQGKNARESILKKMAEIMPKVGDLSEYAPKIEITHIKPEEIGMLIGPGGKNINGIIAATGAQVDIEDDGTVMVSSMNQDSIDKALASINGMFKQVNVGEEYDGKVVRIAPFGAFVEILPGRDGLVHVSQMAPHRVENPSDVVSEGQTVHVRVTEVDPQGKIGLSMLFGADIKPESEGRPGGRSFGGERRGGFSGERRDGGQRREFGGGRGGGFSRDRRPSSGGGRRGAFGSESQARRGGRGGNRY